LFCDLLRLILPLDDVFNTSNNELGAGRSTVKEALCWLQMTVADHGVPCVLHPVPAREQGEAHTEPRGHGGEKGLSDAIGHFLHTKTRSHLNSEVNV